MTTRMTADAVETGLAARVRRLVEEVLAATPHFVVELDVRGKANHRIVEVFVDSEAALTVDELARISRELEFLLETEAVIEGHYVLNVSSPGVERPLKLPRQYRKNVGRKLRVHHRKPGEAGETETTGELVAADDDAIDVALDERQRRRIPYDDILWAKVQLPW